MVGLGQVLKGFWRMQSVEAALRWMFYGPGGLMGMPMLVFFRIFTFFAGLEWMGSLHCNRLRSFDQILIWALHLLSWTLLAAGGHK